MFFRERVTQDATRPQYSVPGCLPWRSHVSRCTRSLHWLSVVKSRIYFKLGVIIFKTMLYGLCMYLHEYLVPYTCAVNRRRSNPDKIILKTINYQRRLNTSFQHLQRSFAYSAPRFWNYLPLELRHSDSLAKFRQDLKTYLFALAYPP